MVISSIRFVLFCVQGSVVQQTGLLNIGMDYWTGILK